MVETVALRATRPQRRKPNRDRSTALEKEANMPLAKITCWKASMMRSASPKYRKSSLIEGLGIPPDDFFQIHHVLPRNRYLHTPAFLGQIYSDDMILLELTYITGRPKETRLALLNACRDLGE